VPKVLLGFLVLGMSSAVSAQTPVTLAISGTEAKGSFEFPGGISGDLSFSFEQAVGLNEDALDVSVRLVDPLDPQILARLPGPEVTIPPEFPVLIRIAPSATSALTISGVVSVSIHTHNLVLAANSPLALYAGPADGPLRDVTRSVGIGSYRAGGSGGGFGSFLDPGSADCPSGCAIEASDYMIVADARPIDQVITEKAATLESAVNGDVARTNDELSALPVDSPRRRRTLRRLDAFTELQRRVVLARAQYAGGALDAAVVEVAGLLDYLKGRSGDPIDDVWRAHDSRPNVAGQRRAAADTLRFSLVKSVPVSAPAPEPESTPAPAPTPTPAPPPP
jgi:hypothetical protein